ncbi:SGNH/GDSL hydrolase family protein [Pseudarthrobacter sp. N5]|uniref:SGNH/GDSL hydrolase family protein n=1 Tax=Pseudarthrobacter sp. N5 TaxID=3418416 RepID=UPI003CE6B392
MIAAGVLLSGCGQPQESQDPRTHGSSSSTAVAPASSPPPSAEVPGSASSTSSAKSPKALAAPLTTGSAVNQQLAPEINPASLPVGSLYRNPANGRDEVIVADIRHTVVLIGDSQSEPVTGWPRQGLAAMGYNVHFCGLGGTGFVAANGKTGNYIDALQRGDWKLPFGSPSLLVIEGGGNDAARGATDAQIVANAERLILSLRQRYPGTKLAMIGTLARGTSYGGGRRTQVDSLLGTIAARNSIPFVSVGDWLTKYDQAKNLADGVHMNATGHKALGLLLAGRLKELGLEAPKDNFLDSIVRHGLAP